MRIIRRSFSGIILILCSFSFIGQAQAVPSTPILLEPVNNAIITNSNWVNFSWTSGLGTYWSFELETISGSPIHSWTMTSRSYNRYLSNGSYRWRVQACGGISGGCSEFSNWNIFTVDVNAGSLQVSIIPQAAIDAGAKWKLVEDFYWRDSGNTQVGVSVGNHTVEFKPITGWTEPDNKTVTINKGQTTTTIGTYGTPSQPDLIVQSPSVSDSTLTPGQSFTIYATVRNQGAGTSSNTTLRWYQSTNSTISTADTQIGTDPVSSLTAGSTSPENITVSAPGTDGTYWVGACVDAVSGESNTSNQCSSGVQIAVSTEIEDYEVEIISINPGSVPLGKLEPANVNQPLVFSGYIKDSSGQPIGNESFGLEDPVSQVSILDAFTTDEDGLFIFRTDDNHGYSFVKEWGGVAGLYAFVVFKNSNVISNIVVPVNPESNMYESDFQVSTSFEFNTVSNHALPPKARPWVQKILNGHIPDPNISEKKSMTRDVIDSFLEVAKDTYDEWNNPSNVIVLKGLGSACISTGAGCAALAAWAPSSVLIAMAAQFADQLHDVNLITYDQHKLLRDIINYGPAIVSLASSSTALEDAITLFQISVDELHEVSVRRAENNLANFNSPSIIVIELTDKNENVYQLSFGYTDNKPNRRIVPSIITPLLLHD